MLISSTGCLWMRSHAAWKIIRSNLHQSNRPRDENGRQYLSDDTSVRSSLRQRASTKSKGDTATRPCRSWGCINVERRTCHLSNSPRLKPNCADNLRQLRPLSETQRRYPSLPFVHKYSWSIRAASSFQQQKFVPTPCFPPLMRGIEHIFVSNLQTVFGIKHT